VWVMKNDRWIDFREDMALWSFPRKCSTARTPSCCLKPEPGRSCSGDRGSGDPFSSGEVVKMVADKADELDAPVQLLELRMGKPTRYSKSLGTFKSKKALASHRI